MNKNHHIPDLILPARILAFLALCLLCLAANGDSYTVKRGDTLSAIAKREGITIADLQAVNGIKNAKELQIGQTLIIPNPDAPLEYTVRSGDTLEQIARKHQTTALLLKEYNRLKNADNLSIGQTILIPGAGGTSAVRSTRGTQHPLLSPTMRRRLNGIPVKQKKWRYIVIHHSATDSGSVAGMDNYHRKTRRMKNGLAYHFVIGNGRGMKNGEVAIGNRWTRQIQGGHLASDKLNEIAIGICLVGNFEKRTPNAAQLESLEALLADLLNRTSLPPSAIRTHRAINNRPTRCPGRKFPIALVKSKF